VAEVSTLDAVQLLRGAFPRQSFNRESEGAYAAGLADLDAGEVVHAVAHLIKTATSLPTVADIRALCGAAVEGEEGDRCPKCGSVHVAVWKSRPDNETDRGFGHFSEMLMSCMECGAWGPRAKARAAAEAKTTPTKEDFDADF
jgi:hypothetical protein